MTDVSIAAGAFQKAKKKKTGMSRPWRCLIGEHQKHRRELPDGGYIITCEHCDYVLHVTGEECDAGLWEAMQENPEFVIPAYPKEYMRLYKKFTGDEPKIDLSDLPLA